MRHLTTLLFIGFLLVPSALLAADGAALITDKIKIKAGDGSQLWAFKPKDENGAKLYDGKDAEIARYRQNTPPKIKVVGPDDVVLGAVEGKPGKWRIVDPDDFKKWVLQQQDDGDWKVEDGDEVRLVTIKNRNYGWKIVNTDEQMVAKSKSKDGKTKVVGPDEETVLFYTKDGLSPLASAIMAVEDIPLPVRGGMALRLHAEESK